MPTRFPHGLSENIDPTQVDSEALYSLGSRRRLADGTEYVYIEADAAIAAFEVCIIHGDGGAEGVTTALVSTSDAGVGKHLAVPQVAIASGKFGWGCIYAPIVAGKKALVAASCVAFRLLCTTATKGVLDDTLLIGSVVRGIILSVTATGAVAGLVGITYPVADDITQT